MTEPVPFVKTEEYNLFRSWAARKAITTLQPVEKLWYYYECGPKEITPLVCLPGVSGGADTFWRQMLLLCQAKGYHIISVDIPPYWSHNEFVIGFEDFLNSNRLQSVHLLGCSLGGFLAQFFAQQKPDRVCSLILTNSFCCTKLFYDAAPCMDMFRLMPNFLLKRSILKNFPQSEQELEISRSIDFMVDQLQTMPHSQVASRLTLNCTNYTIGKLALPDDKIAIIDALDEVATLHEAREQLYRAYPNAKMGFMKKGGNFPYLSFPDEFNVQLEVHLRHVVQEARIDMLASKPDDHNAASESEMDDEERQRQEQWRQEVLQEQNEAQNQKKLDQEEREEQEQEITQNHSSLTPLGTDLPSNNAGSNANKLKGEIEIEIGTGTDPFRQSRATPNIVPDQSAFNREFVAFPSDNLLDSTDEDLTVVPPSAALQSVSTTSTTVTTTNQIVVESDGPASSIAPLVAPAVETSEVSIDPNLAWSSQQPSRHTFEEIPL